MTQKRKLGGGMGSGVVTRELFELLIARFEGDKIADGSKEEQRGTGVND